ncbi:MAG TPA: hypothetical protein VHE33_15185 [Acidobacteriaceae bacterium]|nr:hypothetical protein [Acidobacteriaceae bacterium]
MIAIGLAAMHVLNWMFVVGFIGSLLVVVISFFEDLGAILGKE